MIVLIIIASISVIIIFCIATGFCVIEIYESHILTLIGKYWGNPFCSKINVSLKAQNLNVAVVEVNDKDGNSIMMGCAVFWEIIDTPKLFLRLIQLRNISTFKVKVSSEKSEPCSLMIN